MLIGFLKVIAVILTIFVALPISFRSAEEIAMELVYNKEKSHITGNLFIIALTCVAMALMLYVLFWG